VSYAIEFRFPEGVMYAGMYMDSFGWAPTLKTALLYDKEEDAQRVVNNAYGKAAAEYAFVVPVKAGF
jgi:hypothetical protein